MLIEKHYDLECIIPFWWQSKKDFASQPSEIWMVSCKYDQDVSGLFPYLNALIDDAVYYEAPQHVRFLLEGYHCLVYPHLAIACFFPDKADALRFIDGLVAFLNATDARKETIVPNHNRLKRTPIINILKILPKTNCRECGYATCMAFAAGIYQGHASIASCPHLSLPISVNAVYPVLDDKGAVESTLSLPIDTADLKTTIQAQHDRIAMLEAALQSHHAAADDQSTDRSAPSSETNYGLTGREIEVLKLIAKGYTNNDISSMLFVSPHTIKSHMVNIFNKMNVSDRTRAAVLATREKLI